MTTITPPQTERIDQVIREYDAQGWHRTGTETDLASARWLAERVGAAGLEPVLEPFPLDRVDPRACFVEIGGARLEGLPLFDGSFTDADGVRGVLGSAGSTAAIGLLDAPVSAPLAGALVDERRSDRHAAIVVITRGRRPGLAALNAPAFAAPFGPPVLQVSSEAGDRLAEQAARGTEAHVVVHADRIPCEAFNVVASRPGSEPDLPPLVVMTPRSGWWQCASERGGGIACWLEAIRAVREQGTARTVIFLASSGHELGHRGLAAFMAARPALARAARAWIHLGANIGAAQEGGVRLIASDDELERLALDSLAARDAPPATRTPRGTVPNGEAHNVHVAGGRYISLVGGNALFHLESDRWPDAVDLEAIGAYARAMSDLALRLAAQ